MRVMASFFKEFKADYCSGFPIAIWGIATVFLTVSGPFGAYEAIGFGSRLGFWFSAVGLGLLVGTAVRAYVRAVLGLRRFPASVIVTAGLHALVLVLPSHFLARTLSGGQVPHQPTIWEVGLFILSLSLAFGVLRHWSMVPSGVGMAFDNPVLSTPQVRDVSQPRLLMRLDARLRAPLVAISVHDHYVDVVTRAGRQSLLLRMTDAIAETDGCEGASIHRSHWVARDAARALERAGPDRWSVVLVDDSRLPLARAQKAAIADWELEVQRPTDAIGAGNALAPVSTASAEG